MSSSEGLAEYVRAVGRVRRIPIEEEWVADVAYHLKKLLNASALVEQSTLTSQDLAPRFEP